MLRLVLFIDKLIAIALNFHEIWYTFLVQGWIDGAYTIIFMTIRVMRQY